MPQDPPIRPLAVSRLARIALAANPRPRVAGVFERGLALEAGGTHGLVFCGTRSSGLLPSQLVLRKLDLAYLVAACDPGDVLPLRAIEADGATMQLDEVRTFDVPPLPRLAAAPVYPAMATLDDWLRMRRDASGLGEAMDVLLRPGHGLAEAFTEVVEAGDGGRLRRWIGRGSGSTPAGDDMLVGALAWLQATRGPHAALAHGLRALEREFDRLTTRTSAGYLRCALGGRFAGDVVALLRAVARGRREGIVHRATRLAAHGATSGTDVLAGLVLAARVDVRLVRAPAPVR